ncbi:MAG: Prokaryotic N-methylation motif domain protein [Candidatus Moranbacteria bacterium GW2011_GWC2_37_8]|nr:MAG: Prokaryotic N-methylation motif domain protein [Candidatus Moranbacteria bacterium GW2011_GWC2_37_8]KKQ62506.1 MAG: Prokaryotic N-methylation motif domain protein [Parcubacteria group bacterium GW2011_GWC1_38_22]
MKLNKNKKNIKSICALSDKKGFSLVEVIIAIAILTLGISAITILMASNIKSSKESKNLVVAMGLAQEGIELVRNFKDTETTFKSSGGVKPDGEYRIDTETLFADFTKDATSDKRLYLNSAGGFYTHDNTSAGMQSTKFYRKAIISNQAANKQVVTTSFVSWNSTAAGGFPEDGDVSKCTIGNKCISITSVMMDIE